MGRRGKGKGKREGKARKLETKEIKGNWGNMIT